LTTYEVVLIDSYTCILQATAISFKSLFANLVKDLPVRLLKGIRFAYVGDATVAQVKEVVHRLACSSVVIDDDGRGVIAESALDLNGWNTGIERQLHVLGAKGGRENDCVDAAPEKGLHSFTLTLSVTISVEDQDVEAMLDCGVLDSHRYLSEERIREDAVKGQPEGDRPLAS
jgi:hypothetical protein